VKLKVFDSLFVPLAKWSMLLTGNYRCITPEEPQSIRDAVHGDLKVSQSIYDHVDSVARRLGVTRRIRCLSRNTPRRRRVFSSPRRRPVRWQWRAIHRAGRPAGETDLASVGHVQCPYRPYGPGRRSELNEENRGGRDLARVTSAVGFPRPAPIAAQCHRLPQRPKRVKTRIENFGSDSLRAGHALVLVTHGSDRNRLCQVDTSSRHGGSPAARHKREMGGAIQELLACGICFLEPR